MLIPQEALMTTNTIICAMPTAAMDEAPRPPTRKMSTMPTDRWRRLERTTGRARAITCLRMSGCMTSDGKSADPRELLPLEHVDHASAPDGGFEQNHAGRRIRNLSDDGRMPPVLLFPHGCNERFGGCTVDDRDQNAFVRNIERIEAQEAAGAPDA